MLFGVTTRDISAIMYMIQAIQDVICLAIVIFRGCASEWMKYIRVFIAYICLSAGRTKYSQIRWYPPDSKMPSRPADRSVFPTRP